MKKITLKIFLSAILLIMLSAVIGNICLAASSNVDSGMSDFTTLPPESMPDYAPLPPDTTSSTVARIINATLGLLGILCVLGIFVCVPLGIYFLTKKEFISGAPGEKLLIDIGEILNKGWNLIKNNYQQFINPILILAGTYIVFFGLIALAPFADNYNVPMLLIGFIFILLILGYIFVSLWMTIVIIKIIANLYLGLPVDMDNIYEESFRKVPSYLWVNILNFLVVLGGTLLFIIPGIIFSIWFTFAPYINILAANDNKGVPALKLSYYLTKGRWLDIFIRLFVCGLIVGLASLGIMLICSIPYGIISIFAGDNIILSVIYNVFVSIVSLIITPLSLSFVVILYYSLIETRPLNQPTRPTPPAPPAQQ